MEKINVLIVEDNLLVAEFIAAKLRFHNLEVIGSYSSGEEAIKSLETSVPDLVLMDIELSGTLDGITTAEKINDLHDLPIIYLSEHTDPRTVDRAKRTTPANYLSKPFNEFELIRAIDLAFYNFKHKSNPVPSSPPEFIFVRTETQHYTKVFCKDILYLKADRTYCEIITEDKTYLISNNMSKVHEQLNHPDFVRVHRSYVVNMPKITAIEGNMIRIKDFSVQMNDGAHDEIFNKARVVK